MLLDTQFLLLFGPHERRVGFVIPHRVAEVGIHKHVWLVHVANHALACRYGACELVFEWVPGCTVGNCRVVADRLTAMTVFRIRTRVARIAIIGVNNMARRATGRTVIAGLIVGAKEPGKRIVESRLVKVDQRHRDARARSRPTIRLANIRATGLFESLNLADGVRDTCLREQV